MRFSVLRAPALIRWRSRGARATGPDRPGARVRARLTLVLAPAALVLVLWAAWTAAEPRAPESTDPEYDARLARARAARAEHPDRPLGLVLGTSRTTAALMPELLSEPDGVYWVNAGRIGSGPVLTRVMLHRLLRDGVRPAVLVFEVMPVFFELEGSQAMFAHLGPRDLWVASWYSDRPFEYDCHILRSRLKRLAGPAPAAPIPPPMEYLARGGYPNLETGVAPAERVRRLEIAHSFYGPALQRLTVRSVADRAFRATLRAAVGAGSRVVLLRAPEGPVFRSWYDPDALARFDDYLARVAAEHGALVVDARSWLDEEDFSDSHHSLKRGAEKFTVRFARELSAVLAR